MLARCPGCGGLFKAAMLLGHVEFECPMRRRESPPPRVTAVVLDPGDAALPNPRWSKRQQRRFERYGDPNASVATRRRG